MEFSSTQTVSSKRASSNNGLESLAPEILHAIMTKLPELLSLDCILRASPSAFRVFNNDGPEITDAILASGQVHGHIRIMIRIIALIRSGTLPIANLGDFKKKVTVAAMWERIRPLRVHLAPRSLSRDTPPNILRGILALNRHIVNLSLDLIKIYLERFKALKPRRLIDPSKCPRGVHPPLRLPEDQMEGYPVLDVGPPRWDEEQRVIRGFWRIQLLFDLRKAAECGKLDWPDEDINTLKTITVLKLYDALPVIPTEDGAEAHPEYHEIASIEQHLLETHGISTSGSWLLPDDPPREVTRDWTTPLPEDSYPPKFPKRSGVYLTTASYACNIYLHQVCSSIRSKVPFKLFWKYGFAFWSLQRISGYGLCPEILRESEERLCTYRWLSLLDEED